MTDNNNEGFQHDGDTANLDTENDNSEEENEAEDTHSPDGDENNQDDADDKTPPFNEHPRWKEREDEWNRRFNDQEVRHQNDLKAIREEFSEKREQNANNTKIPSWFGGNQEQWDAYRADRDTELKQAEERAYERLSQSQSKEQEAIKEATEFMKSELAAIESDKTLNPEGKKIDPNKLLKIVMENELIDTKGRWNYRAGFKLMNASAGTKAPVVSKERKAIAAATGSESKAESKPVAYKTSADFKKNRPW